MECHIHCKDIAKNKAARRHSVTRKETLAVCNALCAILQYLLGKTFLVRIDHKVVGWMMTTNEPDGSNADAMSGIPSRNHETVRRHNPNSPHDDKAM